MRNVILVDGSWSKCFNHFIVTGKKVFNFVINYLIGKAVAVDHPINFDFIKISTHCHGQLHF